QVFVKSWENYEPRSESGLSVGITKTGGRSTTKNSFMSLADQTSCSMRMLESLKTVGWSGLMTSTADRPPQTHRFLGGHQMPTRLQCFIRLCLLRRLPVDVILRLPATLTADR